MKVNNKCVNNMCKYFWVFLLPLVFTSCTPSSSTVMMTEDYPSLYQAIYERDADAILPFTEHDFEAVRKQAWRALISTPVDSLDKFIEAVKTSNTEEAWAALSTKELTEEQLASLMTDWDRVVSLRAGISQVLGQQGGEESLAFLVRNFEQFIFERYEFNAALAISRLLIKHEISSFNEDLIIRHAAIQDDQQLLIAYFYGYFRGGRKIENAQSLKSIWDTYLDSEDPLIQQYMLKIAFQSDLENSFKKLDLSGVEQMNVQLAIELAGFLNELEWSEKLADAFTKLLNHQNPVVNEVALNQLKNKMDKPEQFDSVIISNIVENEEKEASVRLSGISALKSADEFLELANTLSTGNEYLLIKKLNIFRGEFSTGEFLSELEVHINSDNRMEVLFAVQALNNWWPSLPQTEKSAAQNERVRELLFEVLNKGDRSIAYSVGNLLMDTDLIVVSDYERFEEILAQFRLPEDVEVYQGMGGFLKEEFEEQAKPLIDSLAAKGNTALNNTLRNQGWEIPETEGGEVTFREPNWSRLLELGFNPVWVLDTDKGIIRVEMNVLSAPATISGMDSLTTAGAYDDVAFHRVAPNFVVQGGDVETGDGFGGPDYVVPTEASEEQYWRSKVGIASAGTDTEGSQYFFMHQWAPHLNGRYTIVGEVIEGMDVVDKMMVGDKVKAAYWENFTPL
ncbi:MAG: peptidylprolyl isomerase [Balneolaceae bacterium]